MFSAWFSLLFRPFEDRFLRRNIQLSSYGSTINVIRLISSYQSFYDGKVCIVEEVMVC